MRKDSLNLRRYLLIVLFMNFFIFAEVHLWGETSLSTHCAYFRQDTIDYTGAIHIYLKNTGRQSLRIKEMKLNGKSVGMLVNEQIVREPMKFREKYLEVKNQEVMWYRIWPNPIPSGKISQVIIRLASFPKKDILVDFSYKQSREKFSALSVKIPIKRPCFRFSYVGFSKNLKTLYVYLKKDAKNPVRLSEVYFDGRKMSASLFSPEFFHNSSLIKLELLKALKEGSFHTIKVISTNGAAYAYQVKVKKPEFVIGVTDWNEKYADKYEPLLINTVALWGGLPYGPERLSKYNLKGILGSSFVKRCVEERAIYTVAPEDFKKDHPALAGFMIQGDEPDGRGNWLKNCREAERAEEFCRWLNPRPYSLIPLDHLATPKNYYTFGEIPQAITTHAYCLPGTDAEKAIKKIKWECSHCREASYPHPPYYIPGVWKFNARGGEEARIEAYTAISEGIKGLIYWPYRVAISAKAWSPMSKKNPAAWDFSRYNLDVSKVHAELAMAGPLLFMGDIIPNLVRTEDPDLDVAAILSGENTIIITILNKDFVSEPMNSDRKKLFTYTPREQVGIDVELPSWFTVKDVFIIDCAGPQKMSYKPGKKFVKLTFPRIYLTKMAVITQDSDLYKKICIRFKEEIFPKIALDEMDTEAFWHSLAW